MEELDLHVDDDAVEENGAAEEYEQGHSSAGVEKTSDLSPLREDATADVGDKDVTAGLW